jgi:glucans biosynthesis protein C
MGLPVVCPSAPSRPDPVHEPFSALSSNLQDAPKSMKDAGQKRMETRSTLPSAASSSQDPAGAVRVSVSAREERYHSLDALRAFALLLGVVFHAAESFHPGVEAYWAIADRSPSETLAMFRHASHSFRLELFFLIAGFFAHLLYHRRGPRGFIRNRLSRILVPLVMGWVVLYPVLVYLWLLGASVGGRLEAFGVPAEMTTAPLWFLVFGFFVTGQFIQKFDLTHLWFLHQLLILYGLFLLLRAVGHGWLDRKGRGLAWIDHRFAVLCASRWKVVWLAVMTIPMLLLMRSWDVDTPKGSLLPYLPTTLLFGLQFGFGWLLHRQPSLLQGLAHGAWGGLLLLGTALVWPTYHGVWRLVGVELTPETFPWIRGLHALLYALMMWSFILGFLSAFLRFRQTPSRAWRYVADASYWIYLVHLPLVVWLQIVVAGWPLSWTVKYPLILVVSMPLLFLSYHFLVRSTFIGVQLNGRKYPRAR